MSVVGGLLAQGKGAGVEDDGEAQLLGAVVDGPEAAVIGVEALVGWVQLDAARALLPAKVDLGDELLLAHGGVEADEGNELGVLAGDLAGPVVAALEAADHLAADVVLGLGALGRGEVGGQFGESGVGHFDHGGHVHHHRLLDAGAGHQRKQLVDGAAVVGLAGAHHGLAAYLAAAVGVDVGVDDGKVGV